MEMDDVSMGSAEAPASSTSGAGSMGFAEAGRLSLKTAFLDTQNKMQKGNYQVQLSKHTSAIW